jgi:hypothetical protein
MKTTIVRSYSGVIERPIDEVRAQFADMQYHVDQNVHPDITFTLLESNGATCRFKEEITVVGMRQVDEIVNTVLPNGDVQSDYVGGMNKGATLLVTFSEHGAQSTAVSANLRIPVYGAKALIAPILGMGAQAALAKAFAQDKKDLESGNYTRYRDAHAATV